MISKSERHERGLLDTSVIIDLPSIPELSLPRLGTISAISLAELSQGPYLAADPKERSLRIERLQEIESMFLTPLPFDAVAARVYGSLVALVVGQGRMVRPRRLDLMIAAIAAANDLPLYTRNGQDFVGLGSRVRVEVV